MAEAKPAPLCFQCYRADLDRKKALAAAGQTPAASREHFQFVLPLEPINRTRLAMLKAEHRDRGARTGVQMIRNGVEIVRTGSQSSRTDAHNDLTPAPFEERRRRAQIAARRALQSIVAAGPMAVHAAELQLPESWLPFVLSR